jgi:hypothetical protein
MKGKESNGGENRVCAHSRRQPLVHDGILIVTCRTGGHGRLIGRVNAGIRDGSRVLASGGLPV